VAKKTYQAASSYAKQGSKSKKKRTTKAVAEAKPAIQVQPKSAKVVKPAAVTASAQVKTEQSKGVTTNYSYVITDLKRTVFIAAGIFIILIILVVDLG
jgi:hypothetical protein